jgi:5-methylcytosine-specific restriction endonuclease McrA
MNKFFTSDEVYKDRLKICKACDYYFKPTGQCKKCLCFMKIKARLAPMACPVKYWNKTTTIENPKDLPKEIINEILDIWKDLKTGRAKDHDTKAKMIDLYNTIFMTSYSTNTNCGSCLSTCFDGIKKLYNTYK